MDPNKVCVACFFMMGHACIYRSVYADLQFINEYDLRLHSGLRFYCLSRNAF